EKKERSFTDFNERFTGEKIDVKEQILDKKRSFLFKYMGGELENLCRLFLKAEFIDEDESIQLDHSALKEALGEFLVRCPVYRLYPSSFPLMGEDRRAVKDIF